MPNQLIRWYEKNKRSMPWRESKDPYGIWISEIMLQQTQVDTVIPYFHRFIQAFPTVFELAQADEDAVFKLWEGLGYYSRARNLMRAARQIVADHKGIIPNNHEAIIKLPGIGPYTAGAVLSIAYGLKTPAVDGNVMRVYSRLKACDLDIAEPKNRKAFEVFVSSDMPSDTSAFSQGLMELGALICTPKNPKCQLCPLMDFCEAKAQDLILKLPVKSKKSKQTVHQMAVLYCQVRDQVLLIKKNDSGLLSGLWGFPLFEAEVGEPIEESIVQYIETTFRGQVVAVRKSVEAKHVFSHRIWQMTRYDVDIQEVFQVDYPEMKWVKAEEIEAYALSTALRKLL
jgi:A/G-specific adenine glycosylase